MKRFGIKTTVRVRKPSSSIIENKKGKKKTITSKRKIYELIIGSTKGFLFFKKKIAPLLFSAEKKNKIINIGEKAFFSNIVSFKYKGNEIPVYGLKSQKTFDLMKKTCKYCELRGSLPLSVILKNIDKKRLFMRDSSFYPFFDIKEYPINGYGKNRKHYYPNEIGMKFLYSNNITDLKKEIISLGGTPIFKKIKPENVDRFQGEQVRYVFDEEPSDMVFDLSMNKNSYHHYNVNGIVTHNCNTPARYVIQAHTKFGMTPMHPSNIIQAIGRAGRTGLSEKGDAIILCPKHEITKEAKRIFNNYKVTSTLTDANILMFHVLSYVKDEIIKTNKELYEWHKKTLSSVQGQELSPDKCTTVLENLRARGMIIFKDGYYKTTKLGDITAQMYMSPLDVSDWFRNFSKLEKIKSDSGASERQQISDNIKIAQALARCYSWGTTWSSNKNGEKTLVAIPTVYISEREKNSEEVLELCNLMRIAPSDPNIKYVSLFYRLLSGKEVGSVLNSYYMTISNDIERIISTLQQCDMQIGRYYHKKNPLKVPGFNWGDDWKNLMGRLKYGVSSDIAELVCIPGIGKKRAEKLRDNGIKTLKAFTNPMNKDLCERAIGAKTHNKTLLLLKTT